MNTTDNPFNLTLIKEPHNVLFSVENFTVYESNQPPKVIVTDRPGEVGTFAGGWHADLEAAKQWIDNRRAAIKRNRKRIAGEKTVVRRVVKDLLAAGYSITVNDGEEETVQRSTKFKEIVDALMTTDEDYLLVSKPGAKRSFVRFVYGNDASEVICDHGVSLEEVLKGAWAVCARLEARGR